MGIVSPFDGGLVAPESIRQEAGDATYGRDADPREIVNLAVGQALLQVFDDLPAVYERLEFRGRAQILEEIAALVARLQADDGLEKGILGTHSAPVAVVSVRLHNVSMY